ncbi:MAG: GNAT family N-acetyltransferase [Bdellovibrionales bacterium]
MGNFSSESETEVEAVSAKTFDLQPVLVGERLRLRPLKPDDFEKLYAVCSDPFIWEQHPEKTRYQRGTFERFFQGALDSKGALIASDCKSGEVIGTSRFVGFDIQQKQVEVGYTFLARRCWGRGYNLEMKKLMLNHAFRYVNRIVFYIGEQNMRSRYAVEKIGAQLVEKIRREPKEGAVYYAVVYAIERTDFYKNPIFFPVQEG